MPLSIRPALLPTAIAARGERRRKLEATYDRVQDRCAHPLGPRNGRWADSLAPGAQRSGVDARVTSLHGGRPVILQRRIFMVVLRSLFFIALIPGTVAGVIPWLLVQSSGETVRLVPSLWLIGVLPLLAGLVLFFWCNGLFTFVGKGTLAPIDAPIFLVRAGPYHWIRNPMYVAVLTIILSEAILFHSLAVVGYALAFGTFLLLWVPF